MTKLLNCTWPAGCRLKKNREFQTIYGQGRSFVDGLTVMYILPIESETMRVGLAVGKKLGCAVVRNGIKRKMREVLRHVRSQIKPGYHLIWMAKKPLVNRELPDYYKTFLRLAGKADILLPEVEGK